MRLFRTRISPGGQEEQEDGAVAVTTPRIAGDADWDDDEDGAGSNGDDDASTQGGPHIPLNSGTIAGDGDGHADSIRALAVSRWCVFTASADGTIKAWNPETHQCVGTLVGHSGCVRALDVSDDGRRLVSGSFDNTVKIWGLTPSILSTTMAPVTDPCVSVSDETLATSNSNSSNTNNNDAHQSQERRSQAHSQQQQQEQGSATAGPSSATPGPRRRKRRGLPTRLLSRARRTRQTVISDLKATLTGHTGKVYAVTISEDGNHVASASKDRTIKLWNMKYHHCEATLQGHRGGVRCVLLHAIKSTDHDTDESTERGATGMPMHPGLNVAAASTGATLDPTAAKLFFNQSLEQSMLLRSGAGAGTNNTSNSGCDDDDDGNGSSSSGSSSVDSDASDDEEDTDENDDDDDLEGAEAAGDGEPGIAEGNHFISSNSNVSNSNTTNNDTSTSNLLQNAQPMPSRQHEDATSTRNKKKNKNKKKKKKKKRRRRSSKLARHHRNTSGNNTSAATPTTGAAAAATARVQGGGFCLPGVLMVSGSEDCTIKLWDLGSMMCVGTLTGHNNYINTVAITPRGDILASASGDKTIRLWSVPDHRCLTILTGHTDWVNSLAITQQGRYLVSGAWNGIIKIYILETHDCLATFQAHARNVSALKLAPDDSHIVSASRDRTAKVWDLNLDERVSVWHGHAACAKCAVVSADGTLLCTGGHDAVIKIWDTATGDCIATIAAHSDYVNALALTRGDMLLVSASGDRTLRVFNFDTRRCLQVLKGHTHFVRALATAHSGQWVVSGSWDQTLRMWDLDTGKCLAVLGGREGKVTAVAVTRDDTTIISGSSNNHVRLWSAQNHVCLASLPGHHSRINALAVTNDGHVISGSGDCTIRVWNLTTRKCAAVLRGHTDYVNCLVLSQDADGHTHLVSGSHDGSLIIWSLETRTCVAALGGHTAPVTAVVVSNDGRFLYSGSKDISVRVWPVASLLAPHSFFGLPHFPTFAIEGTIQYDRFHADAAQRMRAIRTALHRFPLTLTFHMPDMAHTPLGWAAGSSSRLDILHALFATPNLPLFDIGARPSLLRQAIFEAKDEEVVRAVTTKIVQAARAQDEGVERPELPSAWRLSVSSLDESFTEDIISCVEQYPGVAADFLDNLGLVRANTDSGFSQQHTRLPGPEMIVAGHHLPQQHDLWHRLKQRGVMRKLEKPSARAVVTEARVVPVPYAGGFLPDGRSFLDALVETGRAELFNNYIARAIVRFKWECYGRRTFQRGGLFYLLSLLLVTTFAFLINLEGKAVHTLLTSKSGSDVASVVVLLFMLGVSTAELSREVEQWKRLPDRLHDFWNWLDACNIMLVFVVGITYMSGWQHTRALLAVSVYLRWFGSLYYMQAFKRTGPLVRMVLVICFDMRFFLMLLGISIMAAWVAFRVLLIQGTAGYDEALGDPANGLLVMFNMLLLVDFDIATLGGEYVVLVRIIFLLSMILVPVVLLNLLIALMSDSYERIQDRADIEFQLLRARILREQEAFMSEAKKKDPRIFPKWLHVLVPKGGGVGRPPATEQWLGVLHVLRSGIDALSAKLDGVQQQMKQNAAQRSTSMNYQPQQQSQQSHSSDNCDGGGGGAWGGHVSVSAPVDFSHRERTWLEPSARRETTDTAMATLGVGDSSGRHGTAGSSDDTGGGGTRRQQQQQQQALEDRMVRLEAKLDRQHEQLQAILTQLAARPQQ
ncbi:WD-40 repeat protein [Salpingoeca rosetta]|uniref:WD-40 repeat protein n=1 Tax=Salpingoeca rosetta (strain ATCC 50818 / BSB-021) TaxID=946362 RepID=F2UFJ6_SALR5|nr:WD-40 repeat protein [Salpingoeca rosetta]EGD75564.1 WD-40 repeat protein [Salpingoeca rosetta]|eukprot:XP_004992021.1 WD-40 repeat protein [Salpingoeca rosetta]